MITMTELTFGLKWPTLLVVEDELWSFGGGKFSTVGEMSQGIKGAQNGEVWKMLPAEGAFWEYVGSMDNPGHGNLVVRLV